MSKLLLVATVLSTIVFASCTQLNANGDEQVIQPPQILHNQGCYAQIDEYKVENGEPISYIVSDFDRQFILELVYTGTHAQFIHDKVLDVCNININNAW